tara:strand:- start:40 stop:612 length:573 start_codon:yes stop_codon:yes gene_type:complete
MNCIHKSHSRKDLIDIIDIYELDFDLLENYREETKDYLLTNLWIMLQNKDVFFTPKQDTFLFFENIDDIKSYLARSSPNKQITDKTLLDINKRVKSIIYYCTKCSYEPQFANYDSLNDIIRDAEFICIYGNLPAVRRAIKLLNLDSKIKDKFHVSMSQKTKKSLDEKERIKRSQIPKYKKQIGQFIVKFE